MKTFSALFTIILLGACSAGDQGGGGTRVDRLEDGEVPSVDPSGDPASSPSSPGLQGGGQLLPDDQAPPSDTNCGLQTFNVERRPADVLLVLDRSGSMKEAPGEDEDAVGVPSKWDLTVPALNQVVLETNSGVSWGMKSFPEGPFPDDGSCSPATISDTIHVPIAPDNANAVIGAIGTTTPEGDGTPTGHAVGAAVRYLSALQTENRRYIVLATDGEPSCAPSGGEDTDSARTYAISAVTDAFNQGFPVFVVGVATTKDTATEALNGMAMAGGVPRSDPNPLATRYYLANTQDELIAAFRTIAGQIASCVFPLSEPPPVPDNIGIKVDGVLVPQDPARQNGWEYTDASLTAVEVFGPTCGQIQTSARDVQVIYACEGVVIQ